MRTLSKSPRQTRTIAARLAKKIAGVKGPVIITLKGELGSGKTTFIQGFVKALGVRAKVKSPTFLLVRHYELSGGGDRKTKNVYHVDCYRVAKWQELRSLDIQDILKDENSVVLIEWPERISKILPKKKISVSLHHKGATAREIITP